MTLPCPPPLDSQRAPPSSTHTRVKAHARFAALARLLLLCCRGTWAPRARAGMLWCFAGALPSLRAATTVRVAGKCARTHRDVCQPVLCALSLCCRCCCDRCGRLLLRLHPPAACVLAVQALPPPPLPRPPRRPARSRTAWASPSAPPPVRPCARWPPASACPRTWSSWAATTCRRQVRGRLLFGCVCVWGGGGAAPGGPAPRVRAGRLACQRRCPCACVPCTRAHVSHACVRVCVCSSRGVASVSVRLRLGLGGEQPGPVHVSRPSPGPGGHWGDRVPVRAGAGPGCQRREVCVRARSRALCSCCFLSFGAAGGRGRGRACACACACEYVGYFALMCG